MDVAFLGLGRMGAGMARNLLRAGHALTVWNRTPERAAEISREGARAVDTPAAAAAGAEAVLTMLSDDAAVEEVMFGSNGAASALGKGSVHISHSTISVAFSQRLAEEHAGRAQAYVAAPVFGRPEAAESATLSVVAAGEAAAIERCRPLFAAVGQRTLVAGGEPWKANVVKLTGNFMIASMMEAFGEAYAVMRKAGVEPKLFLDAVNGLFKSPVYENYGNIIADQRFQPAGFALHLGLKDARLALAAAAGLGAPMPFAGIVHDRLLAAFARGHGELDWSSMTRIAALEAGLE